MLPFERLRALARYDGDDRMLVDEVADCLSDFDADPTQLVLVCRRLLAHHPVNGALWWLCARVVGSSVPARAVAEARRVQARDRTVERLVSSLPFPHDDPIAVVGWSGTTAAALAERPDLDVVVVRAPGSHPTGVRTVDVVEAMALGCTHLLVEPLLAGAAEARVPAGVDELRRSLPDAACWLVTPVDRLLPDALVAAVHDVVDATDDPFADPSEVVTGEWLAVAGVDRVAGPGGVEAPDRLARRVDCPVAPELTRL